MSVEALNGLVERSVHGSETTTAVVVALVPLAAAGP